MKRSVIQRGVWSAGVVLCGTLSGCAVLSVDVDVYKGALVNEDHVQLHQLVALATAAKPMLVQLRDSIEWPSEEMPTKTFKDNRSWYEAGYVTPPTPPVPPVKDWFCKRADVFCRDPVEQLLPTGGRFCQWFEWFCPITEYQFFRNTMAVNVNVVLGLYEELDGDGQKVRRVLPGETRGLTGLTEGYQYASRMADQATGSTDKSIAKNAREQAEHRLIDALVEFATKVLFLANHEGLASPPGTPGLILGGVEKLSRGLMGDFLTDKSMYTFFNSGLAETKKQQYVRVLQAVGNSILFSANELRERNRYEYESRRKVDAEVTAANSVFSPNPRKVVEDLLQELQQEKEQAQKQLVEATARRDDLKSELGQDTPASGLHTLLRDASTEVSKTQKSLDEYRIQTHPIESLHRLLSKEVREEIRAQFEKSGKEDASPPDDFLHALTIALNSRQTTRNGTLTQEETEQFFEAIRSVGDLKTKEAFKAERLWKEYTSTKLTLLFDEFVVYLDRLERQRDRGVKQYEKARDEKKQRRQEVMGTIAQLTDELKKVERLIAQLPKDIDRFETAKGVIAEVTTAVVNDAESAQQFVSPNTVYTLLALHVDRKITAADSGRQQRYRDAQDDLSRRTPPHGRSQLKANDYKSPLAVMDEVIAFLRHQQMNAMARFGKNSEQDKKATEALENAYQHRAGMVYIRQSSAYLRTSFPSTSLQDDPNLAWDNMLLKQGIRNLPFSSQLADLLDPSVRQDRLLTSELDKQYWQNINRVRVSGAGFTNQALVKDDVGNWYVKQYFGDTEKIVKSAKHLALYSLGTKLPLDLSHERGKAPGTKDDSKKSDSEKEAELPRLQQVFIKHRTAYQAHTAEMSTRLAELHGKDGKKALYNQILAEWEGRDELKSDSEAMTALKAALGEEVVQWDKNVELLKKASDRERGLAITKDLQALAKLDKGLSARIRQDVKAEPSKVKAASEVHKVVGLVLLDLLEKQKQGLDHYEQAILFIGDAANPKDPTQEQGK